MTELTFEEFCNLPFQYVSGIRYSTGAHRSYRNQDHCLQVEVKTPYRESTGEWGEGKSYYFIDNDPREFTSVADWYLAYMHKACGLSETPLYEVTT